MTEVVRSNTIKVDFKFSYSLLIVFAQECPLFMSYSFPSLKFLSQIKKKENIRNEFGRATVLYAIVPITLFSISADEAAMK